MTTNNNPWGVIDVLPCSAAESVTPYDFPTRQPGAVSTSRRWDAGDTNRLNEAHWANVSEDILQDLRTDLRTLQKRARHESINNALIDGAIETQQTNVVSANGPALQVLTGKKAFNDLVEALFAQWSAECEYQDGLSLVDLLEGWIAQWMFNGEFFVHEKLGRSVRDYKLHDLGAEAIDTDLYAKNVHSGVEVDDAGRVIAYRIHDPANPAIKDRIPVEFALHCYRRRFSNQRRGFPALGSVLEPTADLRNYDDAVADAARAAAERNIYFVSNHPDAEFEMPSSQYVSYRRRQQMYLKPGWDMKSAASNQPATTYVSYRKEKQTDVGNVLEMPWMILRKDASNHNMSSARFDGSRYARGVERIQKRIERRVLNPIIRRLVRIAQMEGLLPPTPKSKVGEILRYDFPNISLPFSWTWPKPPAVDNLKDAMAERIKMENGTLALSEAIAADGRRPDETLRIRTRDNEALAQAGLPILGGPLPTTIDPAVLAAAMQDAPKDSVDGTPETPPIDTATDTEE